MILTKLDFYLSRLEFHSQDRRIEEAILFKFSILHVCAEKELPMWPWVDGLAVLTFFLPSRAQSLFLGPSKISFSLPSHLRGASFYIGEMRGGLEVIWLTVDAAVG